MPKMTLKMIQRQMTALELQAEKLRQRERIPALHEIVNLITQHNISVGEIRTSLNGGKRGNGRGRGRGRAKNKVAPKYRNPKTGETWSGRGRAARWLAAAEKAGRKRAEFLVKKL